jgi:hypothetical protein
LPVGKGKDDSANLFPASKLGTDGYGLELFWNPSRVSPAHSPTIRFSRNQTWIFAYYDETDVAAKPAASE